jgi:recombinational DNA repair ATPase RecF
MVLTRLSLRDFRSYAEALVAPGPGFVVLTGENGAGKTNVLEAVSLLSPGRGLRGASLSEMARSGGPGGFAVAARLADSSSERRPDHALASGTEVDLGTGTVASAPERRIVRINGAAASANALSEWLSILWLTPAMDRLFTESAGGRRRFLDRLVLALAPGHAVHAARYEAAMRARNKLLAEERADPHWLTALEARMAEHGAAIHAARRDAVAALAARLAEAPEGPFARAGREGQYRIVTETEVYQVAEMDGQFYVARIEEVAAALDQLIPPVFKGVLSGARPAPPKAFRAVKKGTRSVAGHAGTVYAIYGLDDAKPEAAQDFVVSDDPALKPVGAVLEQFMNAAIVPAAPLLGSATAAIIASTRAIFALGTPLDAGGRFRLTSLVTAAVPPDRQALPAQPPTVATLVSEMRALQPKP